MRKASLALALSEGVLSPPILIYKYKKKNKLSKKGDNVTYPPPTKNLKNYE